jgi:two-component system sensor kinase FixL
MLNRAEPQVERAKSLFVEVNEQALRAGAVIERMRALIKRQSSDPQSVDCATILSEFHDLASPIARTHQTRLEVAPTDARARILIDRSHIQQVLMSLFRNALDAVREMPTAERTIRARADIVGEQVELSIADTGPGIPADVARELFRPFFTTKPDGTGLGLSVCRSIIAEHGGTLRFVNEQRGVRFIVSLPLATYGVAAAAPNTT